MMGVSYRVKLADHGKAAFSKSDNTGIDILVEFDHLPDGPVWFHATPDDPLPHGREIYVRALAGEFGAVKPHDAVKYPKPTK